MINKLLIIRFRKSLALLFIGMVVSFNSYALESAISRAAETKIKGDITSAIVFTDANLISLGVVDFNPNELVDLSEIGNAGDEDTLDRRNRLRSYTLPWESEDIALSEHWNGSVSVRLSYVNTSDDIEGVDEPRILSPIEDTSYIIASDFNWKYQVNEFWDLQLGIGSQFIWQENKLVYRELGLTRLKTLLDDKLVNTHYGALVFDPSVQLSYSNELFGHKWDFISRWRYAIGRTFMTENGMQAVSPEAGRWSNQFVFHYGLPSVWNKRNEMRFLVNRVDLSGDVVESMNTSSYYEVGAGWIVDTSSMVSWLDSFGVGLTLNINSGLSGGGLVLLINEKF